MPAGPAGSTGHFYRLRSIHPPLLYNPHRTPTPMCAREHDIWHPGWTSDLEPILFARDAFPGRFTDRNWRNTPGPFYGAETDTCGTGPIEAPDNVLLDPSFQEFIIIQPRTPTELQAVVMAARVEPFEGYGADGNKHWTTALVREWWSQRHRLMEELANALRQHARSSQPDEPHRLALERAAHFLAHEAEPYARQYVYLIENGRPATASDALPTLD